MSDADELPRGWEKASIIDFSEVLMGQSPPSSSYNQEEKGLPFFQGKAEFTELYPIVNKWCDSPRRIAEPNDILMSVRAPVGTTNIANVKCCIGRGLAALRFPYCSKFLFYFLRLIEKKLDEQGTGTTFRAISGDIIRNTICYLPPLPEQRRIVAKIEELFSGLDKGVESLKAARAQLKVYRQAVLKWAFEGRLTNPEVKDGELPEGWKSIKIADAGKVQLGRQRSPKNISKNYPTKYIRAGNITEKGLDLSDVFEMDFLPKEFSQYKLEKGDILLSEASGSATQVGKAVIWKNDIDNCCFQNTVIRLRTNDICTNTYLLWNFRYYYVSGKFAKIAGGVGINHLSANKFSAIIFSYPTNKNEQSRVVAEIESRLSVCDKLEESIEQSLARAESLRQSILKKAFQGRLVPQDPADEPASVLLERIRAQRAAAVAKKATAGGKKRVKKSDGK